MWEDISFYQRDNTFVSSPFTARGQRQPNVSFHSGRRRALWESPRGAWIGRNPAKIPEKSSTYEDSGSVFF
jgi:hypothetical protein